MCHHRYHSVYSLDLRYGEPIVRTQLTNVHYFQDLLLRMKSGVNNLRANVVETNNHNRQKVAHCSGKDQTKAERAYYYEAD